MKETKLTIRQERLVSAIIDPAVKTQREAGLRAGYLPGSVDISTSRALSTDKIRKAIEKRRNEQSDKARGSLAEIHRAKRRLLKRLSRFIDDIDLSFQETGALAKLLSDLHLQEVRLAEMTGESLEEHIAEADVLAEDIGRAVSFARALRYAINKPEAAHRHLRRVTGLIERLRGKQEIIGVSARRQPTCLAAVKL